MKHGRHVLIERAKDRITHGLHKRRDSNECHQSRFDFTFDRAINTALDHKAKRSQQEHGQEERQHIGYTPLAKKVVNNKGPQHVHGPVGEVNDMHHAKHERQSQGH